MKNKSILAAISLAVTLSVGMLTGCTSSKNESMSENSKTDSKAKTEVVNLFTDRHYDTDQKLYDTFTQETGIKVNIVKGKGDELIERLNREGESTEADLLVVADAGRLHRAKSMDLLQPVKSSSLDEIIPSNLRDVDNKWFGLTIRGRVIVYSKDRVNPEVLSTYMDLTSDKWNGKILVRSSSNIYNQSLVASMIAIHGEEKTKEWAQGIVNNMAREPEGNDRAQATAVVAGVGDVAIMNTYYIGKMINSSNPEEVKVGNNVGVFFPDQDGTGTHINVSGIGMTKASKNSQNAKKLMEFLASEKAQTEYAQANYEYPVNANVSPSDLLKSWGDFKPQNINLSKLGELNEKAVKIMNEVNWK